MKIEVIAIRDADSSTDIQIYIDGVAAEFTTYYVDPGAGWTRPEWNEHRDDCLTRASSPDMRAALNEAFECQSNSKYIAD